MEENKELMVARPQKELTMEMDLDGSQAYTSLNNETREEKALLYRAMSNPDVRIGDMINQTINVKDVYMEVVEMVNEETGEIQKCPRVVLIDDEGGTYHSVSFGVFNSLKRIFQVFGKPTWEEPIKVKVIQVTRKEKKLLSLDVEF